MLTNIKINDAITHSKFKYILLSTVLKCAESCHKEWCCYLERQKPKAVGKEKTFLLIKTEASQLNRAC